MELSDRIQSVWALGAIPSSSTILLFGLTQDQYLSISWHLFIVTAIISGTHILRHLMYSKGDASVKANIVELLGFVPIYAFDAYTSIKRDHSALALSEVYSVLRNIMESFVIVAFMQLLLGWMGGVDKIIVAFHTHLQQPQHAWFRCFPCILTRWPNLDKTRLCRMPFKPGLIAVNGILVGVLQFAIVNFLVAIAEYVIWFIFYFYADGSGLSPANVADMDKYFKVLDMFRTVSVACTFYMMLLLMTEMLANNDLHDRFEAFNPHRKFWCIKLVILFTSVQKFVFQHLRIIFGILGLSYEKTFPGTGKDGWAEAGPIALENLILSFECVFFALAHWFAYPATEYADTVSTTHFSILGMYRNIQKIRTEAKKRRAVVAKFMASMNYAEKERVRSWGASASPAISWQAPSHSGDVENPDVVPVRDVWNLFCLDSSSTAKDTIIFKEFQWLLEIIGFNQSETLPLCKAIDADDDGEITFDEFKQFYVQMTARAYSPQQMSMGRTALRTALLDGRESGDLPGST